MHKSIQELAPRISDCLKVIFAMQERGQKISTSAVSEQLGVSDATVTMLFKDFAEAGWVEHTPYHGVRLTALGERKAMEVIRHHRLLELYLARELGYSWDKVHDEADKLEHVISEEFEDKLDALLGHPTVDPHGDPIPSKDGVISLRKGCTLTQIQLVGRAPFGGPVRILVGEVPQQVEQMLGTELAEQIIVTLPEAEEMTI